MCIMFVVCVCVSMFLDGAMPVSAEQTSRTLGLSPVPPPFLTNVRCETRPCFVFFFFIILKSPGNSDIGTLRSRLAGFFAHYFVQ